MSLRLFAVLGLFAALGFAAPVFAQAQPQVTITSPVNGATVFGPDITVVVNYSGPTLVPGAQATSKNDLHLHYLLDQDPTPYLSGTTPIPMGNPNIVHTASLTNTFSGVAPGPHRVTIILGYSDHTAFQPLVNPSVSFTVGGAETTPAQLPRTGDLGNPAALFILLGLFGVLLGSGLRLSSNRRRARS